MMDLDGATFLLQWATGGLLFLWVTTRRREVGHGYGWLMRSTFISFAVGGAILGFRYGVQWGRELAAVGVIVTSTLALVVSIMRRRAGVAGQRARVETSERRVAEMTGIDRSEQRFDKSRAEFPPILDLVPALLGLIGLVIAGWHSGDPAWLAMVRTVVGALFLGAVTDAMLLGHWYLVQPGLARAPLLELIRYTALLWPIEALVFLLPTGMVSVWTGSIDDGYNGMLGWFWGACVITTAGLLVVTRLALRERQYSAVMAATGLLYLAILTGFGMDLVARAVLTFGEVAS